MARHPATSRAGRTGAATTSGRPEGRPPVVYRSPPRLRISVPSAAPAARTAAAVADRVAGQAGDRELRGVRGAREVRVHDEDAIARPRERRRPGEARVGRLALEPRPRAVVAQLERVDRALRGVLRRAAPDEQAAAVDQQAVAVRHVAVAALDGDLADRPRRRRLRRAGVTAVVVAPITAAERDAPELAVRRLHGGQAPAVVAGDDPVEVERGV